MWESSLTFLSKQQWPRLPVLCDMYQSNILKKNIRCTYTLIPVFVASLTACRRLSYRGLNAIVNAQSIMRPM